MEFRAQKAHGVHDPHGSMQWKGDRLFRRRYTVQNQTRRFVLLSLRRLQVPISFLSIQRIRLRIRINCVGHLPASASISKNGLIPEVR